MVSGFGQSKDDLIIRSLQQRTSADEERELAEWRGLSLDNEKRYTEFAAIWAVTAVAHPALTTRRPEVSVILRDAETANPFRLRGGRTTAREFRRAG